MSNLDFSSPVGNGVPPQIIEAEEAILGGILLDPEAISRVGDYLKAEAFYVSCHRDIYQATLALYHQGKPTDLLTVTNWLSDRDMLAKVGGRNKLASLIESTVSATNIDALASLVIDKYQRRQLISAGYKILQLGYETETDLIEVFQKAEAVIMDITSKSFGDTEPVPLRDVMVDSFKRIEEKAVAPEDVDNIDST